MAQEEKRTPTLEQCEEYDLREKSSTRKSYIFKYTTQTGQVKYKLIEIGKVYNLNNPTFKKTNKKVEITAFIYRKAETYFIEDKTLPYPEDIVPIGVEIKFLQNNKMGTYYNIGDLENV